VDNSFNGGASFKTDESYLDTIPGRFVVTFKKGRGAAGAAKLQDSVGIALAVAAGADEAKQGLDGQYFPNLEMATIQIDDAGLLSVSTLEGEDSEIMAIEPARYFYATGVSRDYIKGYRDCAAALLSGTPENQSSAQASQSFSDDTLSTWGLKACKVENSQATGVGIKIAVLDTGLDLNHPDFASRAIVSKSFVPGTSAQDGQGHGTHCVGTSCGRTDINGRRYGVAQDATIYVGKVLNDRGRGDTDSILAGINWAIDQKVDVISMSLVLSP